MLRRLISTETALLARYSTFSTPLSSEIPLFPLLPLLPLLPSAASQLLTQGYAVIPNALPTPLVTSFRQEVLRLQPMMTLNHTYLTSLSARSSPSLSTLLLEKHHVFEADLLDPSISAASPLFASLAADTTFGSTLATHLETQASSSSLPFPPPHVPRSLSSPHIKLQINTGRGGCFPIHFDSDIAVDSRRITAIFYLNQQDWNAAEDGGALRLYPFPHARHVDIAPLPGTCVLFSSTRLLHRVLPSKRERICFSIWLHSSSTSSSSSSSPQALPAPDPPPAMDRLLVMVQAAQQKGLPPQHLPLWIELLTNSFLFHHALNFIYQTDWETSLLQSHPPSAARDETLSTRRNDLVKIQRALTRFMPILQWARNVVEEEGGEGGSTKPSPSLDALAPLAPLRHWLDA